MEECLIHCRAARMGAPNTFVIGDMPFLSYQVSLPESVRNARRFLKEADMDAAKLEGGRRVIDQIKAIVNAGILVIGHIGLTPQSSGQLGGFKAQGRTAASPEDLMKDALAIEEAVPSACFSKRFLRSWQRRLQSCSLFPYTGSVPDLTRTDSF